MPLIVQPNPRRMRAFVNSPSERPAALPGSRAGQLRSERILMAAGAIAALAVVIIAFH